MKQLPSLTHQKKMDCHGRFATLYRRSAILIGPALRPWVNWST